MRAVRIVAVHLLFLASLGLQPACVQWSSGKPDGPWHEAYEPINDPASDLFIAEALGMAVAEFGDPAVPVSKVMLRRSRKVPEARRYRIGEDFSLTECIDTTNGVFVIYLAVDPDHRNYFPLLGHECAHLLNPHLFDWYMEGLATLFSEQACVAADREWGDWNRHFERTRREPYGLSYRMMRELREAFPGEYSQILCFTAKNGDDEGRRHIDIDAWLDTLPSDQRVKALQIIESYSGELRRRVSEQYHFQSPHRGVLP